MSKATNEEWKTIPGYECEYMVSDKGRIKSLLNNDEKILSPADNGNGYLMVHIKHNGKDKKMFAHRAVALAFIENPEGKSFVNHKDFNPLNNCVDNLEWVTPKENAIYSKDRMGGSCNSRVPKSGEKYIRKRNDKYRLTIRLKKLKYEKTFCSLQDAVHCRDNLMKEFF